MTAVSKRVETMNVESETEVASRKRNKLRACVVAIFVALILVIGIIAIVNTGSGNANSGKEELFVAIDYHDVARHTVQLPYKYEMKGDKNTLKVELDKIESVYPNNNRLFFVVHGMARLMGIESNQEKVKCELLVKYSAPIVARSGKLLLGGRMLEDFNAYSTDLNIDAIMETKQMECWHDFEKTLAQWEHSLAVPFSVKESVQLESNGLFVFEN